MSRDEIPPGTLYLLILKTLAVCGRLHGFEIADSIQQNSDEVLQVEEGSLYPALQRMLRENLVEAHWETSPSNRKVRTYRITPAGIRHLEREVSSFEQMLKGIHLVLSPSES